MFSGWNAHAAFLAVTANALHMRMDTIEAIRNPLNGYLNLADG